MPLSNNPGQYADVKVVLDSALVRGGAQYALKDDKAAWRWRQRAYMLRKILFAHSERQVEQYGGVMPSTPYDAMMIRLQKNVAVITFDTEQRGVLLDLEGQVLVDEPEPTPDDLLESALRLREQLEGKDDA